MTDWQSLVNMDVDLHTTHLQRVTATERRRRRDKKRSEDVRTCLYLYVMTDVTAEDSGNYTCEVRGSKSAVLASVTHFVFVRGTLHRVTPVTPTSLLVLHKNMQQLTARDVFAGRLCGVWH